MAKYDKFECGEECTCGCNEGYECTCGDESKMGLALKIGIGVAAVAVVGSLITFAIIKKRREN